PDSLPIVPILENGGAQQTVRMYPGDEAGVDGLAQRRRIHGSIPASGDVPAELDDELNDVIARLVTGAEPAHHSPGVLVDVAHDGDLRVPFRDIVLVDADGVNPQRLFASGLCGRDVMQRLDEVPGRLESMAIDQGWNRVGGITPDIGQGKEAAFCPAERDGLEVAADGVALRSRGCDGEEPDLLFVVVT
ncbi:hypothetical protein PC129_g24904, partial [Phytophthora cactorum]